MEIRRADESDWPLVYPIFRAIVDDGRSYAFPENLSLEAARPWWMEKPPGLTVVAVEAGRIVGSAKMGPNRPGRGSHVATASFMVDPAAAGKGVGTALGHFAIDWARDAGFSGMQFNAVVETNEPAVGLWTKLGFAVIGTVPRAFDHRDDGRVGLHVMYRDL